ncbi:MAG: FKBP-type peptidyl-prolyl cis-trans isomerase, partial [Flavobacteriales bacterium]|nr:FKBP-type peptidyl-prolyl cis-trans isomerase [Flavobacteriales bacterium]
VRVIQSDSTSRGLRSDLDAFHAGDSISVLMDRDQLWSEFGFLERVRSGITDVHFKVIEVVPYAKWKQMMESTHLANGEREVALLQNFIDTCLYADEFELRGDILWRTIEEGSGLRLPRGEDLRVHYIGTLLNGKMVDDRSATENGLLYSIGMQGQLIPGLEEVIGLMTVGERVEVILPSSKAFGQRGSVGGIVPPWSPVRFEVWVRPIDAD